jgi:glucoamylase
VAADAMIVWSANAWASTNRKDATHVSELDLWFVDLPTESCPPRSVIEFTLFWKDAQRWEGRNYSVSIRQGSPHGRG